MNPAIFPGPKPGTRHTPTFAREPRQYPQGRFSMTDEERAQHEANQAERAALRDIDAEEDEALAEALAEDAAFEAYRDARWD